MFTQHNDTARTGWAAGESTLTPAVLRRRSFGKLFTRPAAGAIYAQPLYWAGVDIPGVGARPVVYVGTMRNLVYAFDAERPDAWDPLWGPISLGPSVKLPHPPIGGSGLIPIFHPYRDISREIGIVSTPVLSPERNALYVVAMTYDGAGFAHRLHMLDARTGAFMQKPVTIAATVPGTGDGSHGGQIQFRSEYQNQRAALLLSRNTIYIAFASFGDRGPYHGWVISYDADTLAPRHAFVTTPGGQAGGVWQSGQGLAADDDGNVYFLTGNGTFTHDGSNLGDCLVKLTADLTLASWFSPINNETLNKNDLDLGSGGVLLIPRTRLAVGGGKEAKLYIVDRTAPGELPSTPPTIAASGDQKHHVHGSPVYWESPDGPQIYVWPENDYLKCFRMTGGAFQQDPVSVSVTRDPEGYPGGSRGMPGGFLTGSSNGGTRDTAIVWASHPYDGDANQSIVRGVLRAYDASALDQQLWSSVDHVFRDDVGTFAKFCPPTVEAGRVYLPTFGGIAETGRLQESALPQPALVAIDSRDLLALAWTGTDASRRVRIALSSDGRLFKKSELAISSLCGPALACSSTHMALAWTGLDNEVMLSTTTDLQQFSQPVRVGGRSAFGPALAYADDRLYVAWTTVDGRIAIAWSDNGGRTFASPIKTTQTTNVDPGVVSIGGSVFLLWASADADQHLAVMPMPVAADGTPQLGPVLSLDESSLVRPAVANGERVTMIWTGRDENARLNSLVGSGDLRRFTNKETHITSSMSAPAAAGIDGGIYLAWIDHDFALHVGRLSLGSLNVYGLLP